jgi:hypothetical protein
VDVYHVFGIVRADSRGRVGSNVAVEGIFS